jgi:hypothetical protein
MNRLGYGPGQALNEPQERSKLVITLDFSRIDIEFDLGLAEEVRVDVDGALTDRD